MKIFRKGIEILDAPILDRAKESKELMKHHSFSLSFQLSDYVEMKKGDNILMDEPFYLAKSFIPERDTATGGYAYDLVFFSVIERFKDFILNYYEQGYEEPDFKLTTTGDKFLDIFIRCLKEQGLGEYKKGQFPPEYKEIHFQNTDIFSGLNQVAEAYNLEWWIDGKTLNLGKCEYGAETLLEYAKELDSISFTPSSEKLITRLIPFGSTRNLPSDYRGTGAIDTISQKRLRLPEGVNYVDLFPNLPKEEIVEGVHIFEDIYPRRVGTITGLESDTKEAEGDKLKTTIYTISDSGLIFNEDWVLPGQTLKIIFESGKLIGREFDVIFKKGKLEIKYIQEGNVVLPNPTLCPEIGNKYVLFNFDASKIGDMGYIASAENELKTEARAFLDKLGSEYVYSCKTRSIFCENNNIDLQIGRRVIIKSDTIGEVRSRIRGYEKDLYNKFECTYTVGDSAEYSRLADIEGRLKSKRIDKEFQALKSAIDNSFKDGIITDSELAILRNSLENFKREKESVDSTYGVVYGSEHLKEEQKKILEEKKDEYDSAHKELSDKIIAAIEDKVITDKEKEDVKSLMAAYSTSLAEYKKTEELAKRAISDEQNEAFGDKFLSRKKDDTAKGKITFLKGLVSKAKAFFEKGIEVKGKSELEDVDVNSLTAKEKAVFKKGIEVKGKSELEDLSVSGKTELRELILKELQSLNYAAGMMGSGFRLWEDEDGKGRGEIDNLVIRGTFSVFELIVQRARHQGGMLILSPAGGKITKVEDKGSYWRCEFEGEDDFMKDDQIFCQVFSTNNSKQAAVKRWWRKATSAGSEKVGDDTVRWVNISKSDMEKGSSDPQVDDYISVKGNRTDKDRQSVIIIAAAGEGSPYEGAYKNIDSYSLAGKEKFYLGDKVNINADSFTINTGGKSVVVPVHRGIWNEKETYGKDNVTSHNGKDWISIRDNSEEPGAGSAWKVYDTGSVGAVNLLRNTDLRLGADKYWGAKVVFEEVDLNAIMVEANVEEEIVQVLGYQGVAISFGNKIINYN